MPEPSLDRVRSLVMTHGWNATAYQIINPGIQHWFPARGDGVVGYVGFHRVRVVAGAPVCPHGRLTEIAAEFEDDARDAGSRVCYFGAERRLESILRDSPRHAMVALGAQPAFDPGAWSAKFARHASLRAQLNRARNKHVTVAELPAAQAADNPALARCLREWLATRGLPPLHFLVEPETLARLFDRRVFVAEQNGGVIAFLVASPVPNRNGWLVEQIVRGRHTPNGTAELLLDAMMRAADALSSEYVTLGLSPLSTRSGLPLDVNPRWLRWTLGWIRAHGRRFYNFDGLDAFKAKFRPERWEPVFAIGNEPRFSPVMLYAIAGVFTDGAPIGTGLRTLSKALARELGLARRQSPSIVPP